MTKNFSNARFKTTFAAGLVGVLVTAFALPGYSPNRRAHDHIGNFNFRVEIDQLEGGVMYLETEKEQPFIKCGDPRNTAMIFDFVDDLSAQELLGFQAPVPKTILVFDSDDAVAFSVKAFDEYLPKSKGGPKLQMSIVDCR